MSWPVRAVWHIGSLVGLLLLILIWQMVANARVLPAAFLPGPDRAFSAIVDGFVRGDLLGQIFETWQRMLIGWAVSCVVGVGPVS